MDIASAKQQIKNTVQIYLQKDALGRYRLPLVHQRPIFLLGAPGLGKTAIMQQVADEMGLGLVSYSMTHHTRQSALGLPVIVEKEYGGKRYQVSEYTMSEIIASVYDCMRTTGKTQGILFFYLHIRICDPAIQSLWWASDPRRLGGGHRRQPAPLQQKRPGVRRCHP